MKPNLKKTLVHVAAVVIMLIAACVYFSPALSGDVVYQGDMIKAEAMSHQQMMAADNKVVFFNLWEAMGGNGGISKMAQQGMAGKDYTHINFKGGAYVAKKLFDGIMAVKQ